MSEQNAPAWVSSHGSGVVVPASALREGDVIKVGPTAMPMLINWIDDSGENVDHVGDLVLLCVPLDGNTGIPTSPRPTSIWTAPSSTFRKVLA